MSTGAESLRIDNGVKETYEARPQEICASNGAECDSVKTPAPIEAKTAPLKREFCSLSDDAGAPTNRSHPDDATALKAPSPLPPSGDTPLSKNQQKKRRRHEKAMEMKQKKKRNKKEARAAKALAEGRDLDEEKRVQAERTKAGTGRQKREMMFQEKLKMAQSSFQVGRIRLAGFPSFRFPSGTS